MIDLKELVPSYGDTEIPIAQTSDRMSDEEFYRRLGWLSDWWRREHGVTARK